MATILVIDDDQSMRETLSLLFAGEGYTVTEAKDGLEAIAILKSDPPNLALCDWRMMPIGGLEVLKTMQRDDLSRSIPMIVLTAFGDAESAVQAMQAGAYDFLIKPVDLHALIATVKRALKHVSLQQSLERLQAERFRGGSSPASPRANDAVPDRLIGQSPAWIEAFKRVGQVAQTDLTVLLEGETGTGKEVVAQVIHRNSPRGNGRFVAVNCAAIPEDLVESELFGHERGSFTGATSQRIGSFEQAQSGTLFLDEIGEMPATVQPKLLRVLQEKTFQRIGAARTMPANVRVIAATNRSLAEEVENGRFRADLFYRLNSFHVVLPPLRERVMDIAPLSEYFLQRFAVRNQMPASVLSSDALLALESYDYPGNVRELEQLMNKLAVQAGGRPITGVEIQAALRRTGTRSFEDWREWEKMPFHQSVARWERHVIERALTLSGGNKSEAARRLGIQRRLMYEKLQQFSNGYED